MLSNEAVNASRMIDMHVSVYEAKCDNPLTHIHVRTARGEISRYWSSYIKLNYLLSSDSIHFLAFSSCEMQDCEFAPRRIFASNYIINSSIFFRVRKINIFTCTCRTMYRIENKSTALFPADNHSLRLFRRTTLRLRLSDQLSSWMQTNFSITNHSRSSKV